MKKTWSKSWIKSRQPRRQRKYRYNAPLHIRQKFLRANLSKPLRRQYERRSARVRTGDKVKILRGKFKKRTGEVTKVDVKKTHIFVKGVTRKKIAGAEIQMPLKPSNVQIVELNLSDPKRTKRLKKSEKVKKVE